MKYGLPREEGPKKKWRAAMENELKGLKMEVFFLKGQLDDATKQITKLMNRPAPFIFNQDLSRKSNPFSLPTQNDKINNNFSRKDEPSLSKNPFASSGTDTERPHYQSTWDYDTATRKSLRIHCITCMPYYKDKSFEEIQYEDYFSKGIGFSNQIQRYKDSIQRSSRAERQNFSIPSKNWKPFLEGSDGASNHRSPFMIPWYLTPKPPKAPWPFGPLPEQNSTSDSSASDNVSSSPSEISSDLKLQDKQNTCQPLPKITEPHNNLETETKNYFDFGGSKKDDTLLNQVLLDLRKIGEEMSTMNDRLSKMDSNISDVSSRVSVMDSRLSAVDMFVTMQRFDKKWQGLETRLVNLETPSLAKTVTVTLPVNESISKDSTCPLTEGIKLKESESKEKINSTSSFEDDKVNNSQTSGFGKVATTAIPTSSIKQEADSLSAMDTSDLNLSDFVKSVSCMDTTIGNKSFSSSSPSGISTISTSPSKTTIENALIEMADLKSFYSASLESALDENVAHQGNETTVSYSGLVSSVRTELVNFGNEVRKGSVVSNVSEPAHSVLLKCNDTANQLDHGSELQKISNSLDKDNNNSSGSVDPLGVTEQKDSSATKAVDLSIKEIENDAANEFVMVEKSDVKEYMEDNSNNKTVVSLTNEASSSSEFKIYSDITEYLEINLGKKKNLVYEFGFEAKPQSFGLESEGSTTHEEKEDKIQDNKAATFSADDSFLQFKTNFIENESLDEKQSSPFIFFSKPPEKPSGKNN